jgi:hypothetical protein
MIEREIAWMTRHKDNLFNYVASINRGDSGEQIKNMLGVTMIVVAVLGLVVLAAVNLAFYMLARKTLKARKLI